MRTVFQIFANDLRSVVSNFFALVLVLGIGVFPAAYAWINLYAVNDPYVNTGNMPVAIASNDKGIEQDGEHINASFDVQDSLKDNDSIGWVFTDTEQEAIDGVRSGQYYAAIVFEDNFTYNMYHVEETLIDDEPSITYYSNHKKNAVAPKITDAAAKAVLKQINSKYLETVFREVFKGTGEAADTLELDSDRSVDDILTQLTLARDALQDYDKAISMSAESSEQARSSLQQAKKDLHGKRSDIKQRARSAKKEIKKTEKKLTKINKQIKKRIDALNGQVDELDETLMKLQKPVSETEKAKLLDKALTRTDSVLTRLQELRALLPNDPRTTAGKGAVETLGNMTKRAQKIKKLLEKAQRNPGAEIDPQIFEASKMLKSADLAPHFKLVIAELKTALTLITPLVSAGGETLDDVDPVIDGAGNTLEGLEASLVQIQPMIRSLEKKLGEIIDKVESADESDRAEVLTEMLGGDPDEYSKFFVNLVEVETNEIYKAETFGTGMLPFYTAIALWVGGVMMISVLSTRIRRKKFPKATEIEGFFGRFLTFFIVGQIQAAVIVGGEMLLFGFAPTNPGFLYLAAAIAALAFDLLIFGLVLALGNIGKAIVVVLMVLQIAGSSGTFPIELLPDVFGKIYLFFPFPYAINAMREALSGMYGNVYIINLAELMLFGLVGILLGVFVRKPFEGVDRFVSEKMEETEVL